MSDRIKRILLAALGTGCVIFAAVGVVLPGVPTLGPLLFGSLLLAKSHPRLEKRLVRNRFFAPYLPYIDGKKQLTPAARWAAALMMWTSIAISCVLLWHFSNAPRFVIWIIVFAGLVGSVCIWRFGKFRQAVVESAEHLND